jgi:hypothetical protein
MAFRGTDHLTEAAAHSEYTVDELKEAEEKLERVLRGELIEEFKKARLRSGPDRWLLQEAHRQGYWLGYTEYELNEFVRESDEEIEEELIWRIAHSHLERFQEMGLTFSISGTRGRSLKDAMHYPIYVEVTDDWRRGEYNAFQRLTEHVSRYGLSPAEALDYFAVERFNMEPHEWAARRDVQPEAVRKNVRQARDKFEEVKSTHEYERRNFQLHKLKDVAETAPHDEENDRFIVPDTDGDGDEE